LCFDSDEAGQNAAVRSLDHLLASGLAVRVAVMPAPHDPDSFIKANGGEAFRKLVESADGFFDYYLNRLCKQNDAASDKGRNIIVRDIAEAVRKTGSAVLIDKYAQKTALRLGVLPEAVRAEFKKNPAAKTVAAKNEIETSGTESEVSRPSDKEFWLVQLLLANDDLVKIASDRLSIDWIIDERVKKILKLRFADEEQSRWAGVPSLLDRLDNDEKTLVTEAVSKTDKTSESLKIFEDIAKQLEQQHSSKMFEQKVDLSGDYAGEQRGILIAIRATEKQIAQLKSQLAKSFGSGEEKSALEAKLNDFQNQLAILRKKITKMD